VVDLDDAARVHELLQARSQTLATAESLTGGQLAAALTSVPGASRSYLGGVVSYATEVKVSVLGVPSDLVARHGVVSAECAVAMARGVARLTGADWAVSTTGVAGPDRQDDLPPGTVHVGLVGPDLETSVPLAVLLREVQGRAAVQAATCREALRALAGWLA
jgi:PncC family amidohydrolase